MQKIIAVITLIFLVNLSTQQSLSFISVWSSGSTLMQCSDTYDQLITKAVLSLELNDNSDTIFFMGYSQPNSNINPCVARFDGNSQVWCKCDYETSSDSGQAYGALYDFQEKSLYAVYSTTGPKNDGDDFTLYTKNGWIEEYGIAANSSTETTVILKLDRSNGKPETGSYVYALDDSFFVNYARVIKLEKLDNNLLTITLDSEKYPLNSDLTPQDCTDADNYTWIISKQVEIELDLSDVDSTTANGCNNVDISTGVTNSFTTDQNRSTKSTNSSSSSTLRVLSPLILLCLVLI